jgi:hypothetical protein
MTADPPTPPTQDKFAEIEERYDVRPGGTDTFDILCEDYWWLIEEVKRLRGLGDAAQRVLDDLDQAGFVSREGQEGLRQAMRTAWLDLP